MHSKPPGGRIQRAFKLLMSTVVNASTLPARMCFATFSM
jgi:hypothetical protein